MATDRVAAAIAERARRRRTGSRGVIFIGCSFAVVLVGYGLMRVAMGVAAVSTTLPDQSMKDGRGR